MGFGLWRTCSNIGLTNSYYIHYNEDMRAISLKIPLELETRLKNFTKQKKLSGVIRSAIEFYLNRDHTSSKSSFYMKAKHLSGCIKGSTNLSHDKSLLENYGK